MKTIVVTGATGRVGEKVVTLLINKDCIVTAIGRNPEKLAVLNKLGADTRNGNLEDENFLASAFKNADAAFLLTPVDIKAEDVNAAQYKIIDCIVKAISNSKVTHVVLLSSWGAELSYKVGGIIACHYFEEQLNKLPNLNTVYLRPVWFMENFLWNIGLIKVAGINGLAIDADYSFPMIAVKDIAPVAANYLAKTNFTGKSIHYLNGAKDYSLKEATKILGGSIGKPSLKYKKLPKTFFRKGLIDNGGLTPDAAGLLIEINKAISSGEVNAEARTGLNTTATTLEDFAASTFAPAYLAIATPKLKEKFGGVFLRMILFFIA